MTYIRVLAAGGLFLLLAACSGSSSPAASSTQQAGAVGFAHCMRSSGVANWPDPESSGVFDKSEITTQKLGVSSSVLQSAQNTCQHLLPRESSTQQRLNGAQALQFAQCMRSHGVPNFPDPDGTGRIPDPATGGIDQGSPQFQAANDACVQYRPPYFPSNQAYAAYAATASAS
ncbi:MAG TPA: hypothetical protein VGD55_12710 [Acidothermaceae bacterium]